MDFLTSHNLLGLVIGLSTFLIIGFFHPIVIKCEYHFGTKCWWAFLIVGIFGIILTLLIHNLIVSALLGVASFSCFWSILEIFQQQERVRKGWFPKNPKRKYPFDKNQNDRIS